MHPRPIPRQPCQCPGVFSSPKTKLFWIPSLPPFRQLQSILDREVPPAVSLQVSQFYLGTAAPQCSNVKALYRPTDGRMEIFELDVAMNCSGLSIIIRGSAPVVGNLTVTMNSQPARHPPFPSLSCLNAASLIFPRNPPLPPNSPPLPSALPSLVSRLSPPPLPRGILHPPSGISCLVSGLPQSGFLLPPITLSRSTFVYSASFPVPLSLLGFRVFGFPQSHVSQLLLFLPC